MGHAGIEIEIVDSPPNLGPYPLVLFAQDIDAVVQGVYDKLQRFPIT